MKNVVSKAAKADMKSHALYLLVNAGEDIAKDYAYESRKIIEMIFENPKIGNSYSKRFLKNIKFRYFAIVKYKQIIFYFESESSINIVRVLSSSLDINSALKSHKN